MIRIKKIFLADGSYFADVEYQGVVRLGCPFDADHDRVFINGRWLTIRRSAH